MYPSLEVGTLSRWSRKNEVIGVDPNPKGVLIKRGDVHRGKTEWRHGVNMWTWRRQVWTQTWSGAPASWGKLMIASSPLEAGRGEDGCLPSFEVDYTLAWKIPWVEEPGRLQSMGSLRVGHNWATSLSRVGEGNGNPLQCSCLENPRDRGALWAAVYGVAQSRTRLKRLNSSSSTPWFRTFHLQNCETIHFSLSKPPSLWYFVTVAPQKEYIPLPHYFSPLWSTWYHTQLFAWELSLVVGLTIAEGPRNW